DADGTRANLLSISRDGSGNLVVADQNEQFQSAPAAGSLSANRKTLTIPFANVGGSITVNAAGGSDTLTVDFVNGTPIPAGPPGGITFNGGESTGDDDRLKLTGYMLTTADGTADVTVT